ncbi:MAG: hypothetical protein KatS3mg103_0239 [Phycisphaerales bacterium]|nr:MAG: hypothetical protein KatS3mg103_0239 [Phycisphaerales bacterium]
MNMRDDQHEQIQFGGQPRPQGVSRTLAPEDVRVGQYVAVLACLRERFRIDMETGRVERFVVKALPRQAVGESDEPGMPGEPVGQPLRVVGLSLPFVLVQQMPGLGQAEDRQSGPELAALDVRQVALVELCPAYVRAYTQAAEMADQAQPAIEPVRKPRPRRWRMTPWRA